MDGFLLLSHGLNVLYLLYFGLGECLKQDEMNTKCRILWMFASESEYVCD